MPAFSADVQDLIQRMLTVEPERRISIAEIKEHPCFRKSINPQYFFPRPIPFSTDDETIDCQNISKETIETLMRIGFADQAELFAELSSPENTMAKVFLKMLCSQIDYESLPWDKSMNASNLQQYYEESQPIYIQQAGSLQLDPFQKGSYQNGESMSSMMSYAVRREWEIDVPVPPSSEFEFSIITSSMSLWDALYNIQLLLSSNPDLMWFHSDPTFFIIRNENEGLYISLEIEFASKTSFKITGRLLKGDSSVFILLMESIKIAVGGSQPE